uniref:Tudor domain-containing protein n=1 Tax=Glossina morsitans morsitans TaxID=37546 RepID=A0A1B0FBD3_GLOMM
MSANKTSLKLDEKIKELLQDNTLLIQDFSSKLAGEKVAKHLTMSTCKFSTNQDGANKSPSGLEEVKHNLSEIKYKVGDYVRATYDADGKDYEAKILSINSKAGTCILKYIGYNNQQEVNMHHLVPSWGKSIRQLQYAQCRIDGASNHFPKGNSGKKNSKKDSDKKNTITMPPPPPIPPVFITGKKNEVSDRMSAMLMSWYMSGYYTGLYQGTQMVKNSSKAKNNKFEK